VSKKLLATKRSENLAKSMVEAPSGYVADYEIFIMDDDFSKIRNRDRGRFDAMISIDDLVHVQNAGVIPVLKEWREALNDDGYLHLFVPSLEWAAEQLLEEEPSPMILAHIYGFQDKPDAYRVSGFTMRRLRRDLDVAGYSVENATVGTNALVMDNNVEEVGQLYVRARKK
jgi:hypothetical protein